MPIDFAADAAVFFNPEEFGELVRVDGQEPVVAIRTSDTAPADFANGDYVADGSSFRFSDGSVPYGGQVIEIVASGERFEVVGEAVRSEDGLGWICQGHPLAP